MVVVRERLEQRVVEDRDVSRISGERGPPERSFALAEQRPDEGRGEARKCKSIFDAGGLRLLADVVAVVEDHRAAFLEAEHRIDLASDRFERALFVALWILSA